MFRRLTLALIGFYRSGISPFMPASCRFQPTCSAYAQEAIEVYGMRRGGWLFLKRFARCNPFGGHGYDPVPLPTRPGREERAIAADPTLDPSP